jgi:rhodanese-related sulfurtransferase
MEPNPYFVAEVKEIVWPADGTVYVICRSGGRSAMAVDKLAEAGFTNAFSVIDGMEGDKVKDESSADFGHRTINGWKNSGLPWTYSIDRERMRLPSE